MVKWADEWMGGKSNEVIEWMSKMTEHLRHRHWS